MSFVFSKHDHEAKDCPGCDDRLEQAEPYLQHWFKYMKPLFPSAHVSWVYRDEASQTEAFKDGSSKLEWPKSKHNKSPSQAVDIFQLDQNNKAVFDPIFCAKINDYSKQHGYANLKWGGEFKSLGDSGHFEMRDNSDDPKTYIMQVPGN